MITLHRIQAKIFLEDGVRPDLGAVVPVFHRWIQKQELGELLVDVANYAHVEDGPGIVLIGHEADYAIDLAWGRPGLLYTRKRAVPPALSEAVSLALEQALRAARLLEDEPGLQFRTDRLEITFPDRLRLPNSDESMALVRDDILRVLSGAYGSEVPVLRRSEIDARLPFAVSIESKETPALDELRERLLTAAK